MRSGGLFDESAREWLEQLELNRQGSFLGIAFADF